MKKIFLGALLLFSAQISTAQVVNDNFDWDYNDPAAMTLTSPDYTFCRDEKVNFTITSAAYMLHYANQLGTTPSLAPGIIIPGDPGNIAVQNILIDFAFSQPVCNLRIHFTDLDSNENILNFSTPYDNIAETAGDLASSGGMTNIESNLNNSAGWAQWSGSLSALSFTYNRPGSGFGLIIDSIIFECCLPPCKCDHRATLKSTGDVTTSGQTSDGVSLNSNGVAVSSICIDLPFYQSNVDDECLKCNVNEQEKFGTILSADPIAGVTPELDDPYNLGYSRTICWHFDTPTIVNENIQIDLQFPGVLELSCCKNSVNYCLNVTFKNSDCTSCEYQICTEFPNQEGTKGKSTSSGSLPNRVWSNDFAEQKSFTLSPNPSSGKVEVNLLSETLVGGKLIIFDQDGKSVFSDSVSRMNQTLQLNNLAPGVYLVSIEVNGQISSQRLVISK